MEDEDENRPAPAPPGFAPKPAPESKGGGLNQKSCGTMEEGSMFGEVE